MAGRRGVAAGRADGVVDSGRDRGVGLLDLLLGSELGRSQELENLRELVLGKLDTAADSVSDGGKDLLDLVLALDIPDPDFVDEGRSRRELGVVNTV